MSERAGGLTHEQAWELLPWWVNETLEGHERTGVEGHVAQCRDCRAEAERCRALAAQVRAAEVAPSPHPAQLAGLLRRVDEVERARKRPGLVRYLGSTRVSLPWALAMQVAVLAILLGVVFWPSAPARYRTLSDPPAVAVAARDRHLVRVVFTPTATEAELRRLLLEVDGELVGGPSPLGAYTLAVPAAGHGAEPLALMLEHLRADPRVRLAEPVAGGGG